MKYNETFLILIKSLTHTENTRVDYFYNTAKEMGLKPINLYLDLSKSYDDLVKFVNSIKDYSTWTEDQQGNKFYFKNILNLNTFTKGKMDGYITCENVTDLLHSLHRFGKLVQFDELQKIADTMPAKQKDQNQKTTYKWQGNAEIELPKLYRLMKDTIRLIASDTTPEQFKAVFSELPIDDKIERIEWLNKPVLLAYFIMQLVKNNKIVEIDIWAKAENCFKDINRKSLAQSYQNSLSNTNPKHKGKPKDFKIIESLFL